VLLRDTGSHALDLDLPCDVVAAEITDLEVVQGFIAPLLHESSDLSREPQRWELADLSVAGIGIRPAVDARLTVGQDTLYVVGGPVPGRTPCTLEVTLQALPRTGGAGCALTADHEVTIDAPRPSLARPVARRLLRREVERVVDHLIAEIAAHAERTAAG
jgi:hypothetical protein